MERIQINGIEHILPVASNKYQDNVILSFPQSPRCLNTIHAIHLYIKKNDIQVFLRLKHLLPCGIDVQTAVWHLLSDQPANLLQYHFFVIYDCDVQNLSPRILSWHTQKCNESSITFHPAISSPLHFLYRQKNSVLGTYGMNRLLFGNERQELFYKKFLNS